jgi:uncharacterized protein (DUF305 family)
MPRVISRLQIGLLVAVLSIVALTAASTYALTRPETPADDSAAAGFLRDMTTHHAQAVEMGLIMYSKSQDPVIQALAYDIATSQQAQIGMMQGWLQAWDLSQTGAEPAMAWMGMPMEGRMLGMAAPDEIERLRSLSPDEAEVLFIQLMIPHHVAGVEMGEAVLNRSDEPLATGLAEKIVAAQQSEINMMQMMLEERGAGVVPVSNEMARPGAMDMSG